MSMRMAPPGRASNSQTGFVKPFGPHHCAMCFGSVHTLNTSSRGASKTHVMTSAGIAGFWAGLLPLVAMFPLLGFYFVEGLTRAGSVPPPRIQAPRPGSGGREVEPDEAVERGDHATGHDRPEALRDPELEERHRHFARQEEGDRASEQAEEEQAPAERLEDAGEPHLGHQRDGGAVRGDPCR